MIRFFITFQMFRGIFLGVLLSLLCCLKHTCAVRGPRIKMVLCAGLAYFALPSVLFCFSLPLPLLHRVALCALVMYCFFNALTRVKKSETLIRPDHEYILRLDLFLLSLALLALNHGAVFFDLSVVGDWNKHRSVLMSLYDVPWDPLLCTGFDCSGQVPPGTHLVYYYALYLPGVYVCKLLGGLVSSLPVPALWGALSASFIIWNLLGVAIIFLLLPVVCRDLFRPENNGPKGVFYPVLVFFAGMDYWFIWIAKKTWLIGHAEWGATPYNAQISSFISAWSWVPHQLVVAFLGVIFLVLFRKNFSLFPFCLWSVFLLSGASLAWVGSLPLLAYFGVARLIGVRRSLSIRQLKAFFSENLVSLLSGILITITIFLFYSTKVEAEGFVRLLTRANLRDFFLFHFIEFYPAFMISVAYYRLRRTFPPVIGFCFVSILVISAFHGGNWNDLVMRGSLPALALIMVFCAAAVQTIVHARQMAPCALALAACFLTFPLFLNEYFVALEGMHLQLENGYAVYMQYAGDGRVRGILRLFNLIH
ncbi:MAG TPA: hypothetical protein PK470_05170 [Candidatus Omnitrophota bacterium]|nr:hypothetical protein [Candidatus Omnitrophota bacterium]